jgi:hypothetical protein
MLKNERIRMTRVATKTLAQPSRLLIALLFSAAGLSAFAQSLGAASAPEPAGSASTRPAAPAVAPRPLAKPVTPATLSTPPATWSGLTPKQQALLAPLERDWSGISDTQRSKWLSATPTLATMSGEEIKRVHDRMRDWVQLSTVDRLNARIGFQVARQLTAEQRQARWEAYQALPAEERKALADKALARREAQAAQRASPKPMEAKPKSNIVPSAPKLQPSVPVTTGLVQAKPGATTVLISQSNASPDHLTVGDAKVVSDPSLVDPKTLLPLSLKTPARSASAPRP